MWLSILSFFVLPPWIAFMYSACPSTNGMFSRQQRSASQYQANMHWGADDNFFAVQADRIEKVVGPARQVAVNERFARLVHDADVHCLGMQIDAAVECVLLSVKSHHGPPWNGWRLSPQLSTGPPRSALCEPSGIAI